MLQSRARHAAALLLFSLGMAPAALGAETPRTGTPYVFQTVDSYNIIDTIRVEVTGILQGESAPRTLRFTHNASSEPVLQISRCDRLALLAMNKPGQYLFEMMQRSEYSTHCRLTRR